MDKWLWQLGASRVLSCARGDGNVVKSRHGSIEADFMAWKTKFLARLQALCQGERKACSGRCKKGACQAKERRSPEALDPEQKASKEQAEEASGAYLGGREGLLMWLGPSVLQAGALAEEFT